MRIRCSRLHAAQALHCLPFVFPLDLEIRFRIEKRILMPRKDFEPGMELVTLSEDAAAKTVTARFPLLASQTATYREGPGCQLEPWRD